MLIYFTIRDDSFLIRLCVHKRGQPNASITPFNGCVIA